MKSSCTDIRQLLEEHLDRDPAAMATGELADHLQQCPRCRHEVEQEQQLQESFGTLPNLACPPQVAERLEDVPREHARIETPVQPQASKSRWWSRLDIPLWQPATLAAAAAVVLILVTTSPDQQGTQLPDHQYTQAELRIARQQAESTLLYALGVIHKSEREAIGGILGKQIPQAIKGSLRKTWEHTQGGQG